MADFFSRLAERALGVANTARPRIASIFAPPVGVPLTPASEGTPDPPQRTPPDAERPPQVSATPKEQIARQKMRSAELREPPSGRTKPGRMPSEPQNLTGDDWPQKPNDEARAKRATRIANETEHGEAAQRSTNAPGTAGASPAMRPDPSEPTPSGSVQRPPTRSETLFAVGPERTAHPQASLQGRDQVFQIAASPLARIQRRTEEQGPIVKVSIGRVEVRAVIAPTASRSSSRAAPKVTSLEEYLKQREEARG